MKKMMEIWNKLKLWQQISLVLVVMGVSFLLFFVNTRPDGYYLLYSELEEKETQKITRELDAMGVEYKTEAENTTIQIKEPDVAKIRMSLSEKGLPSVDGVGFELFDSNQLGASSFENNVNYTRALTNTIQNNLTAGIEGIKSVQVQIPLIEQKRFFESDKEDVEATIIVEEQELGSLSETQVKGIQNFVSGAVNGLKPANVTVLNSSGDIISEGEEAGMSVSGGYGKQQEITIQTEERIKKDVMNTLSSVFGYDNIKLTVRTDINFDEIVQNIEKYDPEGTLVSRQQSRESARQTQNPDQEVGMESNGEVIDYEQVDGDAGTVSESEAEEIIENFEVGKTVETIRKNPELQTILVSVYVDETQIGLDKIADLEESVALSAGLTDKDKDGVYDNGDISVKTYEFKKVKTEEPVQANGEEPASFAKDNLVLFIVLGVLAIIIILLGVMLAVLAQKKKKEEAEKERELEAMRMKRVSEEEEPPFDEEEGLTKEEKIRKRLLDETMVLAEQNPEKTIEYIRKSINER